MKKHQPKRLDPAQVTQQTTRATIEAELLRVGASPEYVKGYLAAAEASGPLRHGAPRWILVAEYCEWHRRAVSQPTGPTPNPTA